MGTFYPCCSQRFASSCLPDCSTVAWHWLVLVKSVPGCRLLYCFSAMHTQATTFHSLFASQMPAVVTASAGLVARCHCPHIAQGLQLPATAQSPPFPELRACVAWWLQAAQQLVGLAARLCLEPHMCFSNCKINGTPAAWAGSAGQIYAATMRSNVPSDQPCRNIISFHFAQPATAIASASAEQ